jgi:hypothetical protein
MDLYCVFFSSLLFSRSLKTALVLLLVTIGEMKIRLDVFDRIQIRSGCLAFGFMFMIYLRFFFIQIIFILFPNIHLFFPFFSVYFISSFTQELQDSRYISSLSNLSRCCLTDSVRFRIATIPLSTDDQDRI